MYSKPKRDLRASGSKFGAKTKQGSHEVHRVWRARNSILTVMKSTGDQIVSRNRVEQKWSRCRRPCGQFE